MTPRLIPKSLQNSSASPSSPLALLFAPVRAPPVAVTLHHDSLRRRNDDDVGAGNWATTASIVETCKLNAVDPLAYLTATLTAIVNGHKQSRVEEL